MKRPHLIRFLQIVAVALLIGVMANGAQAQPAPAGEPEFIEKSAFISPQTVAVGCGAGLAAGAFAAALPAIAPLPGQSTLVTWPVVTAWALIGCAVGVSAGLSAVVTQVVLNWIK